jgi:hypothetical protein
MDSIAYVVSFLLSSLLAKDRVCESLFSLPVTSMNPSLLFIAGIDKGGYYHEKFLRGKQFLANLIHRNTVKSKNPKKIGSSEGDINLYAWPYLPTKPEKIGGKQQSSADRFERDQLRPVVTVSGLANWNLDRLVVSPPQQEAREIFRNTFQLQQVLSAPQAADTSGALDWLLSMTYHRQQQENTLLQAQRNRFALALEGFVLATNVRQF